MDYKSKTYKKREAESLQVLGEKLLKLSSDQLKEIRLPEEIDRAITFAKSIKQRIALRRQLQYIGTLMRKIDPEPIQEAIENIEQGNYMKAMEFKETETWRDRLISGDTALVTELLGKYPVADRQQLTQLVRNARKEKEQNKPPRSSRALFRYLRTIRSEQPDK